MMMTTQIQQNHSLQSRKQLNQDTNLYRMNKFRTNSEQFLEQIINQI